MYINVPIRHIDIRTRIASYSYRYQGRTCMYVCMYVCMYMYMYVSVYVYVYVYVCMCEQPRGKGTPGYRDSVF